MKVDLTEELELALAEITRLRKIIRDSQDPDSWIWLGDETWDDLESMSEEMKITIQAGDLCEFLNKQAEEDCAKCIHNPDWVESLFGK